LAGRSRSTFGKRQKEQKRQEKRLEKTARKHQRKLEKQNGGPGESSDETLLGMPEDGIEGMEADAADSGADS